MNLYLVRAIDDRPEWRNPWDCSMGFVIRARNKSEARQLAETMAGDEPEGTWLNPEAATCEELTTEGSEGVLLRDFHAG